MTLSIQMFFTHALTSKVSCLKSFFLHYHEFCVPLLHMVKKERKEKSTKILELKKKKQNQKGALVESYRKTKY